jgi:hypothetical protein
MLEPRHEKPTALAALLLLLLRACSRSSHAVPPDPDPKGKNPPRIVADGLAITAIDSAERYAANAAHDGGLLLRAAR